MTASDITKALYSKFDKQKYQLSNSFIFGGEESDWFHKTSSNYSVEIEVKISRSDFKADFKKIKHDSFQQIYSGKPYVTRRGRTMYRVYRPITRFTKGDDGKYILEEDKYGRKRPKTEPTGEFETYTSSHVKRGDRADPLYSHIDIFRPVIPNKFSFIVPENMVSLEEIPDYSGLYYVDENMNITEVKRAPFIHKVKHDITKTLLDKFYWLSINLQNKLK